jgi:NAD(P)-dependent dehydrogenase (short-subunit alcohol dehydrogenase family)
LRDAAENRGVTYTRCDVTRWDELLKLHEVTLRKYGTVDVVVANAAIPEAEDSIRKDDFYHRNISSMKSISKASSTVFTKHISLISAIKLAIHYFRKLEKKGVIVIISSTAGYLAEPIPAYSASKHGVHPLISNLTLK